MSLPVKAALITFDDGYRKDHRVAFALAQVKGTAGERNQIVQQSTEVVLDGVTGFMVPLHDDP